MARVLRAPRASASSARSSSTSGGTIPADRGGPLRRLRPAGPGARTRARLHPDASTSAGKRALPQLNIEKEPNPALGLRAIRFSLRNRDMFRIQLRAILRASVRGNIRVLVPMITEIEEILEVKDIFEEVKDGAPARGRAPSTRRSPSASMIEVPAAAALTDLLAKEVDFVSIGTNDLIQYYLAVDRSNEFVSYLYKPLHPAVLRLIRYVIQTAGKAGKDVTVCGEMAADPLSALVLLGFGLRTFSMNPIFIPRVKKALRSIEWRRSRRSSTRRCRPRAPRRSRST